MLHRYLSFGLLQSHWSWFHSNVLLFIVQLNIHVVSFILVIILYFYLRQIQELLLDVHWYHGWFMMDRWWSCCCSCRTFGVIIRLKRSLPAPLRTDHRAVLVSIHSKCVCARERFRGQSELSCTDCPCWRREEWQHQSSPGTFTCSQNKGFKLLIYPFSTLYHLQPVFPYNLGI